MIYKKTCKNGTIEYYRVELINDPDEKGRKYCNVVVPIFVTGLLFGFVTDHAKTSKWITPNIDCVKFTYSNFLLLAILIIALSVIIGYVGSSLLN